MADSQDPCPQNADRSCTDSGQADSDGDGKLDKDDPCPRNADDSCTNPCAGDTSGTCKDTDGDGLDDAHDPCANNSNTSCTTPCAGDTSGTCKDTDGDGVKDADDKCPDNPDTSCTGDGSGEGTDTTTKPYTSKEPAYTHESDIGTRFGDRFKQFIADMKATSVFSISGQIFGDVPTGGSSSFAVHGGATFGEQEFSMEPFVPGLAAVRGILYIVSAWAAVKIALLGK